MNSVKLSFLIIAGVLLVGCGITKPVKLVHESEYTFSYLGSNTAPSAQRTSRTILVTIPIASSGYENNKIVYQQRANLLQYYANSRWVSPPSQMLIPVLSQSLRDQDFFAAVVTAPFTASVTYRLDTRIDILRQEFDANKSQVRLVLHASLLNNRSNKLMADRRFEVLVPAAPNPYGGVQASNKAVNILSQRIARFVMLATSPRT